jgi:hypothetical protein
MLDRAGKRGLVSITMKASNRLVAKRKNGRPKNKAAVALGKLGGRKGGLARAKNLTPSQRSAIAKKAAQARWRKVRQARKAAK